MFPVISAHYHTYPVLLPYAFPMLALFPAFVAQTSYHLIDLFVQGGIYAIFE